MPIFEYACCNCGHVFEKLVLTRTPEPPQCPQCGWKQVEQKFSAFATSTAGSGSGKSAGGACAPSGGG
jgi:putative FmdB family regulatory protein